jgi:hypothetical protein
VSTRHIADVNADFRLRPLIKNLSELNETATESIQPGDDHGVSIPKINHQSFASFTIEQPLLARSRWIDIEVIDRFADPSGVLCDDLSLRLWRGDLLVR